MLTNAFSLSYLGEQEFFYPLYSRLLVIMYNLNNERKNNSIITAVTTKTTKTTKTPNEKRGRVGGPRKK